jgi:hypothetical protein
VELGREDGLSAFGYRWKVRFFGILWQIKIKNDKQTNFLV